MSIWYIYSFFSLAAIYLSRTNFFVFSFVKPLPMATLIYPWFVGVGLGHSLIYLGLFLGMLGDILLLRQREKSWFLAGLVAFLSGHLCYVAGKTLSPFL
jgi:uncharacterized membrane protein YhhN